MHEAIAAKMIKFTHMTSDMNYSNILTKALPVGSFHALGKTLLFWNPSVGDVKINLFFGILRFYKLKNGIYVYI